MGIKCKPILSNVCCIASKEEPQDIIICLKRLPPNSCGKRMVSNVRARASEMALLVKRLATKPDDTGHTKWKTRMDSHKEVVL